MPLQLLQDITRQLVFSPKRRDSFLQDWCVFLNSQSVTRPLAQWQSVTCILKRISFKTFSCLKTFLFKTDKFVTWRYSAKCKPGIRATPGVSFLLLHIPILQSIDLLQNKLVELGRCDISTYRYIASLKLSMNHWLTGVTAGRCFHIIRQKKETKWGKSRDIHSF